MWYFIYVPVLIACFVLAILNWYYDRRQDHEILWLILAIFLPPLGAAFFFVDRTYKKMKR